MGGVDVATHSSSIQEFLNIRWAPEIEWLTNQLVTQQEVGYREGIYSGKGYRSQAGHLRRLSWVPRCSASGSFKEELIFLSCCQLLLACSDALTL